jgi:hypothetical protein
VTGEDVGDGTAAAGEVAAGEAADERPLLMKLAMLLTTLMARMPAMLPGYHYTPGI